MLFYHSGINQVKIADLLKRAGSQSVLVDAVDLKNVEGWQGNIALDSGAYREFKDKKWERPRIKEYMRLAHSREFDFVVQLDAFLSEEETKHNWIKMRGMHPRLVPVWQFGIGSIDWLHQCLDEAPVVGIGCLVPPMREKNQAMLDELLGLCTRYPGRFHLFGANWLKAVEQLGTLVRSMDTSKAIDAWRYGHLIFRNTKTGHLQQAPAKVLGTVTVNGKRASELDRDERYIACAQTFDAYAEWCRQQKESEDAVPEAPLMRATA